MFKQACFFSLLCFLAMVAGAQPSLKGRVVSADGNRPVAGASVFLSNSSVGSLTDEQGVFVIPRFPQGRYDLVTSFMGYETHIVSVQSNQLPENLEIILKPRVQELQEVIVETFDKNGWDKWGKVFMENFMGQATFSDDCKLLNRDAVHFRFNRKKNSIRASSEDPLLIENHALGYLLKYSLTKFEYNLSTREFLIQGYPFFEEMQTDRKNREKKWMANRQMAYYGSMLHFMRSIYRNTLLEQKFEIRQLVTVSEAERTRIKLLMEAMATNKPAMQTVNSGKETVAGLQASLHRDTLAYFESVLSQPNKRVVAVKTLLTGDSLAYGIDSFSIAIQFPGRIQIVNRSMKNPVELRRYNPFGSASEAVTTEMYLTTGKPVVVLANGSFYDGSDLMINGFWAWWEKMCTKLPYEYWPPPKK